MRLSSTTALTSPISNMTFTVWLNVIVNVVLLKCITLCAVLLLCLFTLVVLKQPWHILRSPSPIPTPNPTPLERSSTKGCKGCNKMDLLF